jgi:hypothetical protein
MVRRARGGGAQSSSAIIGGVMKWARNTNSTTSQMTSHGMNAAIMARMLRRISSPASRANSNAHKM